jgi:disulfide bond formation protein DsbB
MAVHPRREDAMDRVKVERASGLAAMDEWLGGAGIYLALAAGWMSTLGSLYFSEVRGYVPCPLCWYQRILMYPLALLLTIGILRRDRGVATYVLPMSVAGIGVSTYHYLLQKTNWFESAPACKGGVPCNVDYINWLGFITIPFLALIGFLIITFAVSAARREADETWAAPGAAHVVPVLGLLALVVAFYVVAYFTVG